MHHFFRSPTQIFLLLLSPCFLTNTWGFDVVATYTFIFLTAHVYMDVFTISFIHPLPVDIVPCSLCTQGWTSQPLPRVSCFTEGNSLSLYAPQTLKLLHFNCSVYQEKSIYTNVHMHRYRKSNTNHGLIHCYWCCHWLNLLHETCNRGNTAEGSAREKKREREKRSIGRDSLDKGRQKDKASETVQ